MGGAVHDKIQSARAAIRQEQYVAAASAARDVLQASPDSVDALEILFLCQQAQGDTARAESTLRQVIGLVPTKRWPRGDLARLLLTAGRTPEAEQVLRDAIAIDPANADAHAMLGALLSEREALVPGAVHLLRAIELVGRHPLLVANLGRNLMRQGKLDEAEPLLQAAADATPDRLEPIVHLAELAELRDRFDVAAALLDKAETIAKREGRDMIAQRAHLLGRTSQWRDGLALLDGIANLAGTPLLLRARLRDRAGRHAEAWQDAVTGKAQLARSRGHSYDADQTDRLFTELKVLASSLDGLTKAAVRDDVPQPIFILGFPRSGTTMTEQVLASHSRIRPGGELPFVAAFAELVAKLFGGPFPAAIRTLADHPNIAAQLRDFYLAQAGSYGLLANGADFFTDKMPLNEIYLPLLRLAFPQAPLISVSRDPRDVMVSTMQHDMTHGFHCSYRIDDAAHHFAAVADLTEAYRVAGLAPYHFRYESFVADQATDTARLMDFIGLRAEPAQHAFHQSRRHAPTPSYAQVREPLHDRAVGRWRNYADALAPVMDQLAPAIARGGY